MLIFKVLLMVTAAAAHKRVPGSGESQLSHDKCFKITDDLVENGVLNCDRLMKEDGMICHVRCNDGYFRENENLKFLTCSTDHNMTWYPLQNSNDETRPADFSIRCIKYFPSVPLVELKLKFTYLHGKTCESFLQNKLRIKLFIINNFIGEFKTEIHQRTRYINFICHEDVNLRLYPIVTTEIGVSFSDIASGIMQCNHCIGKTAELFYAAVESLRGVLDQFENKRIAPLYEEEKAIFEWDVLSIVHLQTRTICQYRGYIVAQYDLCVACPVGYYTSSYGTTECLPCPKGTYSIIEGSDICFPCSNGTTTNDVASKNDKDCIPS